VIAARLDRALGVDEMVNRLKRAGWTGADLKAHTTLLKKEGFAELDRFSGGELTRRGRSPLYLLMLEATALRYTIHRTEVDGGMDKAAAPPECPHGFRMTACNACRKEVA